jgi:hypothetical protein
LVPIFTGREGTLQFHNPDIEPNTKPVQSNHHSHILIIIMSLQPFVEPGLRFQLLDPIHNRYDSLDRGSARFKASAYTEQHKLRINAHNTDVHGLSEIRTHDPSFRASEGSSCLRPRPPHFNCLILISVSSNNQCLSLTNTVFLLGFVTKYEYNATDTAHDLP